MISLLELSHYNSAFYVADALELNGHTVKVICNDVDDWAKLASEWMDRQWFYNDIASFNPDIIGISSVRQTYRSVPWMSALLKKWFPEVPIVCGGEGPPEIGKGLIDNIDTLDYVFYGEAEETLPLFLEKFERGNFDDVDGLIYRNNGNTIVNPAPKRVDFSPYIPLRSWDKYMKNYDVSYQRIGDSDIWEKYSTSPFGENDALEVLQKNPIIASHWKPLFGDVIGLILTRGCPYLCSFCGPPYKSATFVDPQSFEKQLDIIVSIMEQYTDRISFFIKDASFDLNKKWSLEIAEIIGSHPKKIEWACQLRPNLVDEAFVASLKKNRCRMVNLYTEAICDRVRNGLLNKQINDRQLINSFEIVKRQKLDTRTNIIVDVPGETQFESLETLSSLRRLPSDHFQAYRLHYWPDADITKLETEIEYEEGLEYDVTRDELKTVKLTSGYSKRPFGNEIQFPINIHGHRLGKLLRSKIIPVGNVLVADTTPVTFDCLSILVSVLALRQLDDHGQPITVLAQKDAVLNEITFPKSVNIVRTEGHPLSTPVNDKFWGNLLKLPFHTMLCSSFNPDEASVSKVFDIALLLDIGTIVWFVFGEKMDVVEFDVASKKVVQSSFIPNVSRLNKLLQSS